MLGALVHPRPDKVRVPRARRKENRRISFRMPSSALFATLVAAATLLAGAAGGLVRRELTKVGRPVAVGNLTVVDAVMGKYS